MTLLLIILTTLRICTNDLAYQISNNLGFIKKILYNNRGIDYYIVLKSRLMYTLHVLYMTC